MTQQTIEFAMAEVIVFIALGPDVKSELIVRNSCGNYGGDSFLIMLFARRIIKLFTSIPVILGAILGTIQVALGGNIIQ